MIFRTADGNTTTLIKNFYPINDNMGGDLYEKIHI